ncbi:hypothetical protein B598_0849 [Chlamydia psittaci GR9]|nr:hypothetical protein [Chlamydia psittaci]AFS23405.1 hypothetical protein B601_0851 [Chlamydia psittaci WS/RT/E30]EPJ33168.1 hypothetical protein CP061683_1242 [Chlamydia psittaci 06-1683]EPP28373.1 hypothetical protein CP082626L3_1081 [Chlamydia psittaci 08-2626_L3]EPP31245.1 hypothetical protein CPC197_0989 [Chlamydia psittaci C1/97]AFS20921.1 hypothetical protein B598_0849 [Chlamydia psittaci GR9]
MQNQIKVLGASVPSKVNVTTMQETARLLSKVAALNDRLDEKQQGD